MKTKNKTIQGQQSCKWLPSMGAWKIPARYFQRWENKQWQINSPDQVTSIHCTSKPVISAAYYSTIGLNVYAMHCILCHLFYWCSMYACYMNRQILWCMRCVYWWRWGRGLYHKQLHGGLFACCGVGLLGFDHNLRLLVRHASFAVLHVLLSLHLAVGSPFL